MVALLQLFSAAVLLALQVLASPEYAELISARQLSGLNPNSLPKQCQSDCSSASTSVTGCTSLDCLCKDSIVSGLAQCLDCAVSIQGSGLDVPSAQSVIEGMVNGCSSTRSPVNSVTISAKGSSSSKGNSAAHSTVTGAGALFIAALGAFVTMSLY